MIPLKPGSIVPTSSTGLSADQAIYIYVYIQWFKVWQWVLLPGKTQVEVNWRNVSQICFLNYKKTELGLADCSNDLLLGKIS